MTVHGAFASSTNSQTWTTHSIASESNVGVGLGFVLGDGIGCIDLDHCLVNGQLTPPAKAFVEKYPNNYVEVSPSGDGLHIWGLLAEGKGSKRSVDGLSIETYSTGRYITVTGEVFQAGELAELALS